MAITLEEVDRLAILREKQRKCPLYRNPLTTLEARELILDGQARVAKERAKLKPLRPDEEAAIAGEIPGAEGRYPARRRKRRS